MSAKPIIGRTAAGSTGALLLIERVSAARVDLYEEMGGQWVRIVRGVARAHAYTALSCPDQSINHVFEGL